MNKQRGQGLVEMALITPILIFMLIGMLEVGYIMRGYMSLLNTSREAARYAVRPGVIDMDSPVIDYGSIITHALVSNAGTLPLEDAMDNDQAGMIITIIDVRPNAPCDPMELCLYPQCDANGENCIMPRCEGFPDYPADDTALHPDNDSRLFYTYPGTTAFETRYTDYATIAAGMKADTDRLNCLHSQGENLDTEIRIIVEMFYNQPQLLGFPLFSWVVNPFPLYAQTTMRQDNP